MKNKNFLKISAIYYIATILICVWFVLGYFGIITNDILSSFLIQIVTMLAVPLLLYTLFVSKNFRKTLSDTGIKKVSSKIVLLTILLGVLLYFFNSFISNFFASLLSLLGWENLYSRFASTSVQFSYGLLLKEFILSAILPAICEEFLHRGIMLHAGQKYSNPRYCLFISSILFGLMHLNIQQFFYATILGFIMGYVALVADSIIPSMILHFMNNALSTYFYYGSVLGWKIPTAYYNLLNYLAVRPIIYIITSCLCVALIVYLILFLISKIKEVKIKSQIRNMVNELNLTELPIEEMQKKVDEVNLIISQTKNLKTKKEKSPFYSKVFVISSFVLSGLVTLCTFIWGLI